VFFGTNLAYYKIIILFRSCENDCKFQFEWIKLVKVTIWDLWKGQMPIKPERWSAQTLAVSPNLATNKNVKLTFSFLEQNLQKKIKYHFRKCQEIASSRKCVFLFKNSQSPGETKSWKKFDFEQVLLKTFFIGPLCSKDS
jgi:hypothetical protein